MFSGSNGTADTNREIFDVLGRSVVLGVRYSL